jgi:hypothetical protein
VTVAGGSCACFASALGALGDWRVSKNAVVFVEPAEC